MNKQKLLKIVNPLLSVSFVIQVVSIVLYKFEVDTTMIHEVNGYVFIALVVCHIYLNWGWIKANIFKSLKK